MTSKIKRPEHLDEAEVCMFYLQNGTTAHFIGKTEFLGYIHALERLKKVVEDSIATYGLADKVKEALEVFEKEAKK